MILTGVTLHGVSPISGNQIKNGISAREGLDYFHGEMFEAVRSSSPSLKSLFLRYPDLIGYRNLQRLSDFVATFVFST